MTNVVSIAQSGANNVTMRNRIINPGMVIDQRNAGAATANTINGYTVDRWVVGQTTTGKLIAQQNAGSLSAANRPVGFTNYLGVTSQSAYSVGASDAYWIQQWIEGFNFADFGWGTSSAATVTLSFWVRSSLTGTFGGSLKNDAGNRSYPFTYTISSANTWEQKTITIAGDTSGTWVGATNGAGVGLQFGLGVGSTYSGTAGSWAGANYFSATGATSVVGTNGATFYITGVQLEKGSTATPFEQRLYTTELQLCQRYCLVFAKGGAYLGYAAQVLATTNVQGVIPFPVTMRAVPSLTAITDYTGFTTYSASGVNIGVNGFTLATANSRPDNFFYNLTTSTASLVAGNCSLLSTGPTNVPIILSAEL